MTGGPTWIAWCWWIGGYVVALAGLVLLLWAMFADRARGRRRCPKCWYDMSAAPAPGLRFSECGHEAKSERKLFKTRRRWRWAFVAVTLLIAGYAAHVTPRVQRDGWTSIVPTTPLIAGIQQLPTFSPIRREFLSKFASKPSSAGFAPQTIWESLTKELQDRAEKNRLTDWQWRWLIDACLRGDSNRQQPTSEWSWHYGEFLKYANSHGKLGQEPYSSELLAARYVVHLRTRKRWPSNVLLCVEFWMGSVWDRGFLSGSGYARPLFAGAETATRQHYGNMLISFDHSLYREDTFTVGIPPDQAESIDFEVTLLTDPAYKRIVRVPVRVGGSLTELMASVKDPTVTSELASIDSARLWMPTKTLMLPSKPIVAALKTLTTTTLAIRLEVVKNGKTVANGQAWWPSYDDKEFSKGSMLQYLERDVQIPLNWNTNEIADSDGDWSVRIIGDPETALRNFECDQYWDGEITIPLNIPER